MNRQTDEVRARIHIGARICSIRKRSVRAKSGRIYHYYSGKWRLGRDPGAGVTRYLEVTGHTPQEVERKLQKLANELQKHGVLIPSGITLREWLVHHPLPKSKFAIPDAILDRPLQKITGPQLAKWVSSCLGKDKTNHDTPPASSRIREIQRLLHALDGRLNEAVRIHLLRYNPCAGIRIPSPPSNVHDALPEGVITLILRLSSDNPADAVLKLLLFSGMRIGEALSLTWDRIHFRRRTITVDRQLLCRSADGHTYYFKPTKNGRGREIPLPAQGIALLQELAASGDHGRKDLIFIRADGEPLRAAQVRARFHQLLKENGFPAFRLHDIRHTTATIAYNESLDLPGVRDLLGHGDSRITADVYCSTPARQMQKLAACTDKYYKHAKEQA